MKKYLLGLISGLLMCGGVVYASSIFASDIDYDNSNSHLKDSNNQDVTNVQEAIDVLYTKANSGTINNYDNISWFNPVISVYKSQMN